MKNKAHFVNIHSSWRTKNVTNKWKYVWLHIFWCLSWWRNNKLRTQWNATMIHNSIDCAHENSVYIGRRIGWKRRTLSTSWSVLYACTRSGYKFECRVSLRIRIRLLSKSRIFKIFKISNTFRIKFNKIRTYNDLYTNKIQTSGSLYPFW